jgi:hypothetical protein
MARGVKAIDLLIERESVYQLLSQTTHENISKNYQDYTANPHARYINLNTKILLESQIRHLYDNSNTPLASPKRTTSRFI